MIKPCLTLCMSLGLAGICLGQEPSEFKREMPSTTQQLVQSEKVYLAELKSYIDEMISTTKTMNEVVPITRHDYNVLLKDLDTLKKKIDFYLNPKKHVDTKNVVNVPLELNTDFILKKARMSKVMALMDAEKGRETFLEEGKAAAERRQQLQDRINEPLPGTGKAIPGGGGDFHLGEINDGEGKSNSLRNKEEGGNDEDKKTTKDEKVKDSESFPKDEEALNKYIEDYLK